MMERWLSKWFPHSTVAAAQAATAAAPMPMAPESSEPQAMLRSVQRHDGLIWVDPAGKIQLRNPESLDGRYPVLEVPDMDFLDVTVNGERCVGERVLEEGMRVHVRCAVRAPESHFQIVVSPDAMQATLDVRYQAGERRVLSPTTPGYRLRITPRCIPIQPVPVTLAQVKAEMARTGIASGLIDETEVQQFLNARESGSLVLARGVAPRPGGGSLDIFWPPTPNVPWTVEAGKIIGHRQPRPARPGRTVTGETLPARAIESGREVYLGPGVTVMSRELNLVAARPGVVTFESGVLDVVPQHQMSAIVPSDQWHFVDGDLQVTGNVSGCRLVVLGNLSISGSLSGSEVMVGGSITVSGSTQESTVSVGLEKSLGDRAQFHVARIIDGMYDLELTINALRAQVGPRMGEVLIKVIPSKFPDIVESLNWLDEALRWQGFRWHENLSRTLERLREQLAPEVLRSQTQLGLIWSLRTNLEMLPAPLVVVRPSARHPATSQFSSVMRCRLDIEGTARINDARSSQIDADEIAIDHSLSGGFASAQRLVAGEVLGTPDGTETSVEVRNPEGIISARTVYPGVVMAVAERRRQQTIRQTDVKVVGSSLKGGDNA